MYNEKPRINLTDRQDRMRYRCPNGHAAWEPTNYHFWCPFCARNWDVDGDFKQLHDAKTDTTLARDEVELVQEAAGKIESYERGGP